MKKISPKSITVWRIREGIAAFISLLVAIAATILHFYVWEWLPWWVPLIPLVIAIYISLINVWLLPKLKYKYFCYEVSQDEISIHKGIIFKVEYAVPLFRVQNIDTTVGPLMKRYGLKGITLRTSAEPIHIPELESDEADRLRSDIRTLINEKTGRTI